MATIKDCDYSFVVGVIAGLEEKIMSPELLKNIIEMSLNEGLSRVKETFLGEYTLENKELEIIFEQEESLLRELCKSLFTERDLDYFIEQRIDKVFSLGLRRREFKEFASLYADIINISWLVRKEKFNLKERYFDGSINTVRAVANNYFVGISDLVRKFYLECREVIEKEENYLVDFLILRILKEYLSFLRRSWQTDTMVLWYYFSKLLNLRVVKFIILGKYYGVEKNVFHRLLEKTYG